VSLRLTYSKATAALSAESVGASVVVTPELPEPAASPASSTLRIAAVAAVVGVLAIGLGGFWLLRSRGQAALENERSQRGRRRGRRRAGPAPALRPETSPLPAAGTAGGFCPQCGRAHTTGDQFCRNCGARLRA
jgi:hypothetical protein